MDSDYKSVVTVSYERRAYEAWLQEVVNHTLSMVEEGKKKVKILNDYEVKLVILDEWEELESKMVAEQGPITYEELLEEIERNYQETNYRLSRYGAICFVYNEADEDITKKHMNLSIHENSLTRYYNSYAFQKRTTFGVSVSNAAFYCYNMLLDQIEKKMQYRGRRSN